MSSNKATSATTRCIPAQTQRPSAQGANARNQHTHSTGAHNANMRNSIVGIWAHRARSRRAQSHKAQSHKVRSRRVQPHTRRHTGREGGRRRRSRAIAFTIEVGPTTKLHEHTEDTARAGKRAQGGHVHRWRDMRAQREHARGAHRPQACARTRTTHCRTGATPSGHAPRRDRARRTQRARATRHSGKHRTGAPRTAAAAPRLAAPAAPRHLFPALPGRTSSKIPSGG